MKKLLGVIGILALAAAMLPAQGHADLRGSFAPITIASGFSQGCETASHRPDDGTGTMLFPVDGGRLEPEWITFTARSLVVGHENVRSIYLHLNAQQSGYFAVIKTDPLVGSFGHDDISYFDPAWSYDGRFLAYIKSVGNTASGLFVQEYFVSDDFEAVYGPGMGADSPVGAEWLVTNAGDPRHPAWHPSSYVLAYDTSVGTSRDIYTQTIDVGPGHIDGPPVRVTFDNAKAEQDPAWSPNGTDIAYTTNKFGPLQIEIVNTSLPPADPNYTHLAEPNFAFVTHNNPSYDPTGAQLLYDAPGGENVNNVVSIWRLDLATKAKCEMQLDNRADADPSWSPFVQHTRAPESLPYSYFVMTSQGGNFGVNIWRANLINSCLTPLPMAVTITPNVINWKSENKGNNDGVPFVTKMKYPAETKALGYVCRSANTGGEGTRLRSTIFNSPTLLNLSCPTNADLHPQGLTGVPNTECFDTADTLSVSPLTLERTITCWFDRRTILDQITALGLVDKQVPMEMTAYSNLTGRKFQGFAYIKVNKVSGASSNVAMISNSPNPFNPVTQIKFAVSKAGTYSLRIYNVQGALVKSLASQRYDIGTHEATWDGRTNTGG
ncbi:MAG TPA: hypothetical protein VFR25_10485, partial [Candidatus Eisenbacteria bacterium]|nr:hypothetical protein [Candidatus Eisenbacteria bacterium]